MAYEFKKLSDVEVVETPTDTANVLIEEDGVIKKAPKTAVGGSGEWDAVLETTDWQSFDSYSWVSGSYTDIKNKILAGEKPNVLIRYTYEYGDIFYCILTPLYFEVSNTDSGTLWMVLVKTADESYWLGVNSDGSFTD